MSDTARIVLVKPGDVLIFGNVSTDVDSEVFSETMSELKDQFGLARVLVFEDDIDLAVQQSSDPSHVGHVVADFMASSRDDEAYGKAMRELGYSEAEVDAFLKLRSAGVDTVGDLANPRPGHPDEWCVKCGQARGVPDKDGNVDWIARWQAPRNCEHELPAEAS